MTNVTSRAAVAKRASAVETKQIAFTAPGNAVRVTLGSEGRDGAPDQSVAAPRDSGDRVTAHRFMIGEIVDLTPNMFRAAAGGQYEIRRLMPASERDGANPSYRIKSVDENHERVASEDELTLSHRTDSPLS